MVVLFVCLLYLLITDKNKILMKDLINIFRMIGHYEAKKLINVCGSRSNVEVRDEYDIHVIGMSESKILADHLSRLFLALTKIIME